MLKFKNIFVLSLFVVLLNNSCIRSTPPEGDYEQPANFIVGEVAGSLSFSSQTALPEKFTLHLNACIKEPITKDELTGAKYWISHEKDILDEYQKKNTSIPKLTNLTKNNKLIEVETDENGCLQWTEEYDYTYNSQSEWILIERHIYGRSKGYPGIETVPIALNPWLQLTEYRDKQVLDYRDQFHKDDSLLKNRVNKKKGLPLLSSADRKQKISVIVDEVEFTGRQVTQEKQRIVEADIKARLKYIIKDIYGKPVDIPIRAGEFTIKPDLLMIQNAPAENNKNTARSKEYKKMNKKTPEAQTQFNNELLTSTHFNWNIEREVHNHIELNLLLQLLPKEKTKNRINTFEGIYFIGSFLQDIEGKKTLSLHPELNEYYRQVAVKEKLKSSTAEDPLVSCIIKQSKNNSDVLVINRCVSSKQINLYTDGSAEPGWDTDTISLGFLQVAKENWLSREIHTQVSTKIIDPFNKTSADFRNIDITVTDLTTGETTQITNPRTTGGGNINFTISTFQNWYKKQRYFLKLIHFSNPTKKMNLYKIIAINPWDYGFTHGYDVTQSSALPTTCLTGDKQFQEVTELFSRLTEPNHTAGISTDLIKKIFCYEERFNENIIKHRRQSKKLYSQNKSVFENTKEFWKKKILQIKDILHNSFRSQPNSEKIAQAFYEKFNSSIDRDQPHSFIHLFRSLNPFPTYLIDSSLNRDFYYNMRFKVTPRIVRYDDIRAGQQNKGPIRDGIYLFQMAVLKNEQEKSNGHKNMIQINNNVPILYTQNQGYTPLFSCLSEEDSNQPDCLTQEDFILPPVNVPVIIRDGTVKTDLKFLIKRKNLMFANSKTVFVFRLLPADPDSVVCKNDCKILSNIQYGKDIDWQKAVQKIQPAKASDYDMIFHTYKTPFIPSEWNNWSITNEMDIDFNSLAELYQKFSDRNSTKTQDRNQQINEEVQAGLSFEEQEKRIGNSIAEKGVRPALKTASEQLDRQMSQTALNVNETAPADPDVKPLQTAVANNNNLHTPPTAQPANISEVQKETLNNSRLKDKDFCASINTDPEDPRHNQEIPINAGLCLEGRKNEDKTQEHLSYFAGNNSLCVLGINSDPNLHDLPEHCGGFESSESAQQSFIEDLNRQIEALNSKRIQLRLAKYNNRVEDKPISASLNSSNVTSQDLKNKIQHLPKLPYLDAYDVENIITSGMTKYHLQRNDQKTGAFIHALCGLWFEKFLSSKYINTKLMLNGFRQSMKKNFYYNLQGLRLPEEQMEEGSEKHRLQLINQGIEELRQAYEERFKQQHLTGHIDNLHEWLDKGMDPSFDSPFYSKIEHRFTQLLNTSPFNNDGPSWTEPSFTKQVLQTVSDWWNDAPDKPEPSKTFELSDYLYEVIQAQKDFESSMTGATAGLSAEGKKPGKKDLHPVRKCIANPTHFFNFEKKVVVGQIHEEAHEYGKENNVGGELTTLNITKEFLLNSQKSQGARQGFETSLNTSFFLLALPLLLFPLFSHIGLAALSKAGITLAGITSLTGGGISLGPAIGYILTHILSFNLFLGAGYNYESFETASKDKMMSVRISQGVNLLAEHTPLRINLKNYQECLVVRPRFSAFEYYTGKYEHIWKEDNKILQSIYENIGLLLCSKGKEPQRSITEHYYYVYPDYAINSVSMDPRNFRNKPFIISLRGKNEWHKFLDSLSCYVTANNQHLENNQDCTETKQGNFEYLFAKKIEFPNNLKSGFYTPRLMHLTGYAPGIYSEPVEISEIETQIDKTTANKFINFWAERSSMDMDIENILRGDTEI